MKIKINKIFNTHILVAGLLFGLLFLGKKFTKTAIFNGVYLYDVLLIFVCSFVFFKRKLKFQMRIILLVVIISFIYFIFSIIKFYNTEYLTFVVRHYAIFIYLGASYFLANNFFTSKERVSSSIAFIILFSKIAIIAQIIFLLISFATGYTNSIVIEGHRYLSPLAVLGVIAFGAYTLAYSKNIITQITLFIFTLLISFSFGHASAFLGLFLMLLYNLFFKITVKQRILGTFIVVVLVLSLLFFPQFKDNNASWRIFYWEHVIHNIFIKNYGLFGNSFGEPYSTLEFAKWVNDELNSLVLYNTFNPYSRWLRPPHNSFLTIIFHIGFVPFLFLFYPIKKIIPISFSVNEMEKELKFLIMAFIGVSTWVFFNVILELPHSSLFYWLLFFTLCYYFKYNYSIKK